MTYNAECWKRRLAVLVIASSWLTGCATADSDTSDGTCPPIVNYSQAEQTRVAEEIAAVPENVAIIGWLADYAVMRDQARACE